MRAWEDDVGETTRVLHVEDHALFRKAFSLLPYHHLHMEVLQAGALAEVSLVLGEVDVALNDSLPDGARRVGLRQQPVTGRRPKGRQCPTGASAARIVARRSHKVP